MFLPQVSQSNLRDLLLQCCMDDGADIRQSAFALLGDLARVCWEYSKLFLLSLDANYDLYLPFFDMQGQLIHCEMYFTFRSLFWDSLCLSLCVTYFCNITEISMLFMLQVPDPTYRPWHEKIHFSPLLCVSCQSKGSVPFLYNSRRFFSSWIVI